MRLVALSEAGSRGPWTSAAEINLQVPLASKPGITAYGCTGSNVIKADVLVQDSQPP